MEKPIRKTQKGKGEREERKEGVEKPFREKPEEGGESHFSGKTRWFLVKILGGVGVKTLLKRLHLLEDGLSSLVRGKQTPRRQGPPPFTQSFQELGL